MFLWIIITFYIATNKWCFGSLAESEFSSLFCLPEYTDWAKQPERSYRSVFCGQLNEFSSLFCLPEYPDLAEEPERSYRSVFIEVFLEVSQNLNFLLCFVFQSIQIGLNSQRGPIEVFLWTTK